MGVLKISTIPLAILFILSCSSGKSADPPAPPKTMFDPLTRQLDHARDVQKTVDQNADNTRAAVDNQERGDNLPCRSC